MIASISGKITQLETDNIVVDVAGIGYLVNVPRTIIDAHKSGQIITLHTQLIVRQDSLALYGFENVEGREYFNLLLGVSGIGPRLALTILSTLTPESIRRAIFDEQAEIFNRVPGVGKKTSQKIIFNLKDKISADEGFEPITKMSEADGEVLNALVALGYSVVEAQAALQSIPSDAPQDVEERLRIALRYFS